MNAVRLCALVLVLGLAPGSVSAAATAAAKSPRTKSTTARVPSGGTAMIDLGTLEHTILDLWDFHDAALSEQRFDSLAATPEVAASPAALVIVRTQKARAQGLQRNFDDATTTLEKLAPAAAALPPGRDAFHARARIAIERGRVLNSQGDPGQARPLFEDAYALADSAGREALAVDAAHMVAIAAGKDDAPLEAVTWNERAIARADSSSDPDARNWRASLLNNLAWTRHDAKQYKEALDLFERALVARREMGDSSAVRVARWSVARCLRSLGRYDEALAQQKQLEIDCATADAPDGYVFEEIGECLYALDRKEESRAYFGRAYDALSQDPWLVQSEAGRIDRLKTLGGR
jgi:tetratricopeptide (TPR) repeat protein